MTPWAGILLILGAFTAMWVLLRLARPWITSPELSRKLLHIGMGLVSLALPWVFPGTSGRSWCSPWRRG